MDNKRKHLLNEITKKLEELAVELQWNDGERCPDCGFYFDGPLYFDSPPYIIEPNSDGEKYLEEKLKNILGFINGFNFE